MWNSRTRIQILSASGNNNKYWQSFFYIHHSRVDPSNNRRDRITSASNRKQTTWFFPLILSFKKKSICQEVDTRSNVVYLKFVLGSEIVCHHSPQSADVHHRQQIPWPCDFTFVDAKFFSSRWFKLGGYQIWAVKSLKLQEIIFWK